MKAFNRLTSFSLIGLLAGTALFATGCISSSVDTSTIISSVQACAWVTASGGQNIEGDSATVTANITVEGYQKSVTWSGPIVGGEICMPNPLYPPVGATDSDFQSANIGISVSVTDASGTLVGGTDKDNKATCTPDDLGDESIEADITVSPQGTSGTTPPGGGSDGGPSAMLQKVINHHKAFPNESIYDRSVPREDSNGSGPAPESDSTAAAARV